MTDRATRISNYLEKHSLMQGFDRGLARLNELSWQGVTPPFGGLALPEDAANLEIAPLSFQDSLGQARSCIIGRTNDSGNLYYVWLSVPPSTRVGSHPTIVRKGENGKFYAENSGVPIYNDRFMYDHQARALHSYGHALAQNGSEQTSRQVTVFATGTGKSYIIAHTLKATGGQGVVIAPKGLGEQIRKDIAEVIPPINAIQSGADYKNESVDDIVKKLQGFKGILVIEAQDIEHFIGNAQHPGWLCQGDKKHVLIDEAHEFTVKTEPDKPASGAQFLSTIAAHNDVLAITATPNQELYDVLGIKDKKPTISMTMYDAMHRLAERPFRPLSLELTQVGTPRLVEDTSPEDREKVQKENEPAMRLEALAGYFGREEYVAPDYFRTEGGNWQPRIDNSIRCKSAIGVLQQRQALSDVLPTPNNEADTRAESIIEAMQHNRIRYAKHKNIAFAVRGELVKNLAHDFQAIHDGRFEGIASLTKEVWKRRAQSAIAAYIQTYARDFGLPESLEYFLSERNLNILRIRDQDLSDVKEKETYQKAIRSIDPELFKAHMPLLFQKIIGTPEQINLQQEAAQAAKDSARSAALRLRAEESLGISSKEARRLDVAGKLETRLDQAGIDLSEITDQPSYYAVAVVRNSVGADEVYDAKTNKKLDITGDGVAAMVRAGKVMHVVNNYRFTTGFSDPDVMMTQRIIENNGDHIERATQILGRPIREKDGVAALHEIVGPFVSLNGTLGVDRHFSGYDVIAYNYLERVEEFERNWQARGCRLWQPTTHIPATHTIVPMSPPVQFRSWAQQ